MDYANYNSGTGQRHYTLYRDAFIFICRHTAFDESGTQPYSVCNYRYGNFYFGHDLIICGLNGLPFPKRQKRHFKRFPQTRSYDDLCLNCRNLYADLYACFKRTRRNAPALCHLGDCGCGNAVKSFLDQLPEMVFFHYLYCNGLGVPVCVSAVA